MNILEKLCFNPNKAEIFEGSIFWVAQSDPHTHTHTHTHTQNHISRSNIKSHKKQGFSLSLSVSRK